VLVAAGLDDLLVGEADRREVRVGLDAVSQASTSSVSMPNFGASSFPVLERPPSMKNSCVNPSWRSRFT